MRPTLILIACLLAGFAPAPFPKTQPARNWTPEGEWVLEWQVAGNRMPLTMSGGVWRAGHSGMWQGFYSWDRHSRTLTVSESNGCTRYDWAVRLDSELSGPFLYCRYRNSPGQSDGEQTGLVKLTRKE